MRILAAALTLLLFVALFAGCVRSRAVPPEDLSDSELDSRARGFLNWVAEGAFDDAVAMMDSKMASVLPASRLKSTWESLIAQVGSFRGIISVKVAVEAGFKVAYVKCDFDYALIDAKVVFDRQGKVSGLWFGLPQAKSSDYLEPPYTVAGSFTEVDVELGKEPWVLPGTLTLPAGEGPFPAVVLVHGSGPQDRDETIGPNKPFKDLAYGLASKGIAVLRYEKRTRQYAEVLSGKVSTFTLREEVVDDAVEAVAFLRKAEKIDPTRVFILGHSLGASSAPRIAEAVLEATGEPPAGLIMLAPSARPVIDLIVEQYRYLAELDGRLSDEESSQLEEVEAAVKKIREGTMKPGEMILGAGKAYWDDLLAYDPVSKAKELGIPIFILQGERDYQVTMEDFSIWQAELGSLAGAELMSFPGLNHLFMYGEGKSSPEEYGVPGNVHEGVVAAIAEWVKSR